MNDSRPAAGRCVFRKDGEFWTIVYEGQTIRMKDARGLHSLAELLRNPGREFHAADLMGAVAPDLGDAGEALDARAKADYRARLQDLRDELAEAEQFNDPGRANRARGEIAAISRELAASVGLGDRDRPASSQAERMRVAVTQRLKTVIAKIRELEPTLGRHLSATVKTGAFCSYNPDRPISWDGSPKADEDGLPRGGGETRRLAAIMFTDIAGYTALMGADEGKALATLERSRALVKRFVPEFHGRIIEQIGDGSLSSFQSAVDAVSCARELQRSSKDDRELRLRIGIHVGDVLFSGTGVVGDGVNVASRIHELAEPGGISVSEQVHDAVRNQPGIAADFLGEKTLKNVNRPIRAYALGVTPASSRAAARRSVRRPVVAVLLLVALAGGAIVASRQLHVTPSTPPALPFPDRPSLAILPFANLSGDPDQDYLSTGMTEDLITDASKLSRLFVIAHASVLPYRGKAVSAREVGRELGVRYVLEGSVRRMGDELRVSARLLEAENGRQLWAERYDRQVKDTFAIQDEILQNVTTDLQVELVGAERERIRRIPTDNLTAYEAFVRAIDMVQRNPAQESRERARKLLERSIALDPGFAEAYASLSIMIIDPMRFDSGSVRRVRELAEHALALDDSQPFAHIAIAIAHLGLAERDQAIAEVDRATALGPNDDEVYAFAAQIYQEVGKPREAVALIEKAMRLNPRYPDWYAWIFARSQVQAENYEEAIPALKKVVLAQPEFLQPRIDLAAAYRKTGREQEAKLEEAVIRRLGGYTEEIVVEAPQASPIAPAPPDEFRLK